MRKPRVLYAPFLRSLAYRRPAAAKEHPFNLPALRRSFTLDLSPITMLIGDNGCGKSTLLEAVARNMRLPLLGGSNYASYGAEEPDPTAAPNGQMVFSWLPRVRNGFFVRAQSFLDFSRYIEGVRRHAPGDVAINYGETPLHHQSHGEGFMTLFERRLGPGGRAVYLMDEPEAALSPLRQFDLLRLMKAWSQAGQIQVIMATHSPILMSFPGALLLLMDRTGIRPVAYEETEHFRTYRDFMADHQAALARS